MTAWHFFFYFLFREKENDKLLTHVEAHKSSQYGNIRGPTGLEESSITSSPGTKSLIEQINKDHCMKSIPVSLLFF